MTPRRIAAKLYATPETASSPDLESFIPLFHRFIQRSSVEGLLIDVADYRHVPEGPGVILVGHDVEYAVDATAGRLGLLTTRKRIEEGRLPDLLTDTLRMALVCVRAIEADGSTGLRFETDTVDIHLVDRLAAPNNEASFEALRDAAEPVVRRLYGDVAVTREHADDFRKLTALRVEAQESADIGELIDLLGGQAAAVPASTTRRQSEWEIDVEELKKLRDEGADFELIDVREQQEYDICHLGGKLIPLGTLPARLDELDRGAHIVVHCHKGPRSARAAELMRESGFSNVWHLTGGISAWIERIDPGLQDY